MVKFKSFAFAAFLLVVLILSVIFFTQKSNLILFPSPVTRLKNQDTQISIDESQQTYQVGDAITISNQVPQFQIEVDSSYVRRAQLQEYFNIVFSSLSTIAVEFVSEPVANKFVVSSVGGDQIVQSAYEVDYKIGSPTAIIRIYLNPKIKEETGKELSSTDEADFMFYVALSHIENIIKANTEGSFGGNNFMNLSTNRGQQAAIYFNNNYEVPFFDIQQ